jgi:hypothetical protein
LSAARHVLSFCTRNDSLDKEEGNLRLRCMGTSAFITAVAMFLGFRVIMEAEYNFSLHYTDTTTLYNESISRLRTYLHHRTPLGLIQGTNLRVLTKQSFILRLVPPLRTEKNTPVLHSLHD